MQQQVGFWNDEILQELVSKENAVVEYTFDTNRPVVSLTATSTAHQYLIDKLQAYESSGILQPVEINIEWTESNCSMDERDGDDIDEKRRQYHIHRVLHEVGSIASSYHNLTPTEILRRHPTIALTNCLKTFYYAVSSGVTIQALVNRIEKPGIFAGCPLGTIMRLPHGSYICTLLLRYQYIDIKLKVYRRDYGEAISSSK